MKVKIKWRKDTAFLAPIKWVEPPQAKPLPAPMSGYERMRAALVQLRPPHVG